MPQELGVHVALTLPSTANRASTPLPTGQHRNSGDDQQEVAPCHRRRTAPLFNCIARGGEDVDGDGASRQSATAEEVVSAGAARGRSLQLVKLEQADSAARAISVGQRLAAVSCQRRL